MDSCVATRISVLTNKKEKKPSCFRFSLFHTHYAEFVPLLKGANCMFPILCFIPTKYIPHFVPVHWVTI